MLQNRNMFVSNCCNFATEIRKDSDWDKKVRGGTWESNLWKQFKSPDTVLNHFTTNQQNTLSIN